MTLRIGFVFDDTLDVLDGVQAHILTLGKELARRGNEVHYLVGQTAGRPVEHIHPLARNMMVAFNGNRMRIPILSKASSIRHVLDECNFDVLHVQAPYSPLFAGRVLNRADDATAVVATYHIAPTGMLSYLGGKMLGAINAHTHRRVDDVISVSKVAADYAHLTAHVDSCVIPNPVDVQGFKRRKEQAGQRSIEAFHGNGPHVVFLGRFVERKGAKVLIEALHWGESHHLFPTDMHVTFAGKGPLLEESKQQASDLHLPCNFIGFIDEDDKPSLLASADVAVFPSTGGESFGIVLLEAIASGSKVVLAGDNPGYRSTLMNQEDVLFPVRGEGRAQALAESIAKALTNQAWSSQVHDEEQGLLTSYDVSAVADQVEEVYRRAIRARRNPEQDRSI
ncbi:glycosyltransferase family 4 protein [Bifidobacterium aquikefiricola]|uniref:Glycosyltransferase family 4 protein n=1 Tax=Bifidobacterium aquikefiricola TaxID=3059038 RepID=A0AB39U979_9BIFI